jgi:hypothetical protein
VAVFLVHIDGFAVLIEVHQGTSEKKVKVEVRHDLGFHVQHILFGVGVVSNFDEILQ